MLVKSGLTYNCFGEKWECDLHVLKYPNGRLVLQLMSNCEPIATCTVNMVDADCPEGEVYVKDWSENEGMTHFLVHNKIIKDGYSGAAVAGFTMAYRYPLTLSFKQLLARKEKEQKNDQRN